MSSKATNPQIQIAEFTRVVYSHTPSEDVTLDDVLVPSYWTHVATKFKPGTRIEVLSADMTWFAELLVIDSSRSHASVAVLRQVKVALPARKAAPAAGAELDFVEKGYEVKFAGQEKKYRVIRKSDKKELKDGFPTEDLGWEFVRNHIKAIEA